MQSKPAAGDGDTVKQTSNGDAEEEQRETDLNLPVPHRKTGTHNPTHKCFNLVFKVGYNQGVRFGHFDMG